ncbi:hypothetical protein [Streptomyces cavernae]|uniref:hypothetical protein n=1 Tax=Streptomyces cavernae TaxID=2259034 RepID=UPI001EE3AC73|nr:hypothetical protein [Streptomyces cavernae]
MSTIEVTADNCTEVTSGNDFVIIDFWAELTDGLPRRLSMAWRPIFMYVRAHLLF